MTHKKGSSCTKKKHWEVCGVHAKRKKEGGPSSVDGESGLGIGRWLRKGKRAAKQTKTEEQNEPVLRAPVRTITAYRRSEEREKGKGKGGLLKKECPRRRQREEE